MRHDKRTALAVGLLVTVAALTIAAPVPKEKPREGLIGVWNNGEPVLLSVGSVAV